MVTVGAAGPAPATTVGAGAGGGGTRFKLMAGLTSCLTCLTCSTFRCFARVTLVARSYGLAPCRRPVADRLGALPIPLMRGLADVKVAIAEADAEGPAAEAKGPAGMPRGWRRGVYALDKGKGKVVEEEEEGAGA